MSDAAPTTTPDSPSTHARARLDEGPHLTPFSVPREDTTTSTTVLSTLAGAHSVGEGILGFFTTREANTLRLVCSEMREAVAGAAWYDAETRIKGNLASWRAQTLPISHP